MDVHLQMSAVKVQGQQNCPSSLSVGLAGLKGLILHWRAQQCSCSQDPWSRCPSVSVALHTASPCGIRMLPGWYSFGFKDEQSDAVWCPIGHIQTRGESLSFSEVGVYSRITLGCRSPGEMWSSVDENEGHRNMFCLLSSFSFFIQLPTLSCFSCCFSCLLNHKLQ